jgi:hypothetical protein
MFLIPSSGEICGGPNLVILLDLNSNYTWRRVQVMKLHIMNNFPTSRHFICLRSDVLLSTLFSNTLCRCSSLNIRGKYSNNSPSMKQIWILSPAYLAHPCHKIRVRVLGDEMRLSANKKRTVESDYAVLQRKIDMNASIEGILHIHPCGDIYRRYSTNQMSILVDSKRDDDVMHDGLPWSARSCAKQWLC